MIRPRFRGLPLVALLVLAVPPDARAARVLNFSVTLNGQPLLSAAGEDSGEAPPAAVWHRLAVTELTLSDGAQPFPSDAKDPLQATLAGKIVVEVSAAGRAEVDRLRLVRRTPTSGWLVAPEEVDRIGRQIGLGRGPGTVSPDEPAAGPANPAPAEEPAPGVPLWVWVGGAIAAALFAVGLMIRLGLNQSPPSRLEFPRTFSRADLPPEGLEGQEGQPADDQYPDDPSGQQQY